MAMLEHAIRYASNGFAVFACHYPTDRGCSCGEEDCRSVGKHPLTRRGVADATRDPEILRAMWHRRPAANVALATGAPNGFDVLDVDLKLDGYAALASLEEEHGPLPETLRARTGSGGEHVLFKHTPDLLNNNTGKLGPSLDFKTTGGHVIAAPSRHASGGTYEWLNDVPLAPLPAWMANVLRGITVRSRAASTVADPNFWANVIAPNTTDSPTPSRHDLILQVATHLLDGRRRVDPYLAVALVHAFNQQHCSPPKPSDEVDKIIGWAIKKKLR